MEIFVADCQGSRPSNHNNQPERRQQLIVEKLKTVYPESTFHSVTETIAPDLLEGIHDPQYLIFLNRVYPSWKKANDKIWSDGHGGLVPKYWTSHPVPQLPYYLQSGYYALDADSPIYESTFRNAMISANAAKTAVDYLLNNNQKRAYVATSIPGHHAKYSNYGGYCFINTAMVAARRFQELQELKVGVLDLDYHAGNGIPDILASNNHLGIYAYSIHVDPKYDYPYFESYPTAQEGVVNVCLQPKTEWPAYRAALTGACQYFKRKDIGALVVAFGADTYKDDIDAAEHGKFNLDVPDYVEMGKILHEQFPELPIVVVQEGGYNLTAVPNIVSNFLSSL